MFLGGRERCIGNKWVNWLARIKNIRVIYENKQQIYILYELWPWKTNNEFPHKSKKVG